MNCVSFESRTFLENLEVNYDFYDVEQYVYLIIAL